MASTKDLTPLLISVSILTAIAAALLILDLCGLVKPNVQRFARTGFARGFAQAPVFGTILLLANLAAATFILYQQGAYPQGSNGTGSTSNPASPVMGWYLTNNCPIANTGQCFFTPANTQQDVTASWGTGSSTITITDSRFVSGDPTKRAFGYVTCNAFTTTLNSNAASGAITTGTAVTISSFTDANHVTISQNPANAVSVGAGVGGCFIWGNLDDSAFAALAASIQNAPVCPKVFLAAGYYMLSSITASNILDIQPTACAQLGSEYGGSQGNLFYAMGYEVEGRGAGNTQIFVTPGFPESGSCTNGLSAHACFVRAQEGVWRDFSITGGDNSQGSFGATPTTLIELDGPGTVSHVTCLNWAAANTNNDVYGFAVATAWEQFDQVNNSGCGTQGVGVGTVNTSSLIAFRTRVENSQAGAFVVGTGSSMTLYEGGEYGPQFTGNVAWIGILSGNATTILHHNDDQSGGNTSAHAGMIGYQCITTGGSLIADGGSDFGFGTGNAAATNSGIVNTAACNTTLQNTLFTAQASGNTYKDGNAGSKLFDQGGNTGFTSGGGTNITGSVIGSASASGTPTISSCGTSPAIVGNNGFFTVTAGGGTLTSCSINFGAPSFLKTPTCVVSDNSTTVLADISGISTSGVTVSGSSLTSLNLYLRCGT